MTPRHWEDDDLIGRLYGAGPDDSHLEECEQCAARWRKFQQERRRVVEPVTFSEDTLARQRRETLRRLERSAGRRRWLPLAPAALATVAVVILAVVLHRPAPAPVHDGGPSDAELFAEASSLAQSDEPQAVESMRGLFDWEASQ